MNTPKLYALAVAALALAALPIPAAEAPAKPKEPGPAPSSAKAAEDQPVAAPAWVKEIPPGTWAAASKNTLADVDPARDKEVNNSGGAKWKDNQTSVTGAWNGGAFCAGYGRSGSLVLCGGGHADYYGNEVYAFDMETCLWARLTNPYRTPKFPIEDGIWPDGTPSVSHTYDQVDYHPGTHSFVMLKTQWDNTGGKSAPVVAMFSLDNLLPPDNNANRDANKKNWRLSPRHKDNYTSSGGWSVYDPKRDLFWANGGSGNKAFVSFDPKPEAPGGRFGVFVSYPSRAGATDAVAAYDPVNDIILYTVFRRASNIFAIDLSNPGAGIEANVKITQGGTPPKEVKSQHGWEWSSTRGAFLYYHEGTGVYEFKQQGPDWRKSEWRWSLLTSPANKTGPADPPKNGIYSRFRVVRYADAEVAIAAIRTKEPVWAFRVPEGPAQ
jgi:hypothetical protein